MVRSARCGELMIAAAVIGSHSCRRHRTGPRPERCAMIGLAQRHQNKKCRRASTMHQQYHARHHVSRSSWRSALARKVLAPPAMAGCVCNACELA